MLNKKLLIFVMEDKTLDKEKWFYELNGKAFIEFVDGASLKFFCERIEEFIQK